MAILGITPEYNDVKMWEEYGCKGQGMTIGFDLSNFLDYLQNQKTITKLVSYPEIRIENTINWSIGKCYYMDLGTEEIEERFEKMFCFERRKFHNPHGKKVT